MDSQIHAAVEQCVFDRLGEKPGPLELVQRTIDVLIALRLDHDNLYRRAGALELALHPLGLPQREAAAASAKSQVHRAAQCRVSAATSPSAVEGSLSIRPPRATSKSRAVAAVMGPMTAAAKRPHVAASRPTR